MFLILFCVKYSTNTCFFITNSNSTFLTNSSLIAGAVIFTIYGIVFLEIDNYIAYVFLFLAQCVPAMFVFLYDVYVKKYISL
jgi:hypothetical protein